MKRIPLILLILLLSCSSNKKHPKELVGHWVRVNSGDYGNFIGSYIYILKLDGKIELARYTNKTSELIVAPNKFGNWEVKDNTLTWTVKDNNKIITYQYEKQKTGIYYDDNECIFDPVILIQLTNDLQYFEYIDKGYYYLEDRVKINMKRNEMKRKERNYLL